MKSKSKRAYQLFLNANSPNCTGKVAMVNREVVLYNTLVGVVY